VIPIVWKGHRSSLIICLKDEPLRQERLEVG
jgi:hypothetical protein